MKIGERDDAVEILSEGLWEIFGETETDDVQDWADSVLRYVERFGWKLTRPADETQEAKG